MFVVLIFMGFVAEFCRTSLLQGEPKGFLLIKVLSTFLFHDDFSADVADTMIPLNLVKINRVKTFFAFKCC